MKSFINYNVLTESYTEAVLENAKMYNFTWANQQRRAKGTNGEIIVCIDGNYQYMNDKEIVNKCKEIVKSLCSSTP